MKNQCGKEFWGLQHTRHTQTFGPSWLVPHSRLQAAVLPSSAGLMVSVSTSHALCVLPSTGSGGIPWEKGGAWATGSKEELSVLLDTLQNSVGVLHRLTCGCFLLCCSIQMENLWIKIKRCHIAKDISNALTGSVRHTEETFPRPGCVTMPGLITFPSLCHLPCCAVPGLWDDPTVLGWC